MRNKNLFSVFIIFHCFLFIPIYFIVLQKFELALPRYLAEISIALLAAVKIASYCISGKVGRVNLDAATRRFIYGFVFLALFKFTLPLFSSVPENWILPVMEFKVVIFLLCYFAVYQQSKQLLIPVILTAGVLLSATLILDFAYTSVLTGAFVRVNGTGEVNYEAMLLLVSICLLVNTKEKNALVLIILTAGILCTFSRTALATLSVVILLSTRTNSFLKLTICLCAVGSLLYAFRVRGLELNINSVDRFYMWQLASSIEHDSVWTLFFGHNPYDNLPLGEIPVQIRYLALLQMEARGVDGFYPFSFHSMWLRLYATWGLVGVGFALYFIWTAVKYALNQFDRLVTSLFVVVVLQGLTMGVFYIGHVSLMTMLAIGVAFERSRG